MSYTLALDAKLCSSQETDYPLLACEVEPSAGKLPPAFSHIANSPENLSLRAVKKGRQGPGHVLRFYETAGRETLCDILFDKDITAAWQVNVLEKKGAQLPLRKKRVSFHVKAWEIYSLLVE